MRTGGKEFFGRGWTLEGTRQGVGTGCNAACVLWSIYNDMGKKLKDAIDARPARKATEETPKAQSGLSGAGPRRTQSVAPAPGSAARTAGLDFSDPKTLAIVFAAVVGVVVIVSLLVRSGGRS